jgi:hypothetical protein
MQWKIYSGESFDGERIFKKSVDNHIFWVRTYKGNSNRHKNELELVMKVNKDLSVSTIFYLDESESFTKEDMREAFKAGERRRGEFENNLPPYINPSFDEWLNGREGNQ